MVHVPECTRDYAYALSNPFKAHEDGISNVCVPDQSLAPSLKMAVRMRGSVATGANNFGYVGAYAVTLNNDLRVVKYSQTANTADDTTPFNDLQWGSGGGSGPVNLAPEQYPYSAADMLNENCAGRLVACGLRVRYVGTELDRGGSIYAYREPDNGSCSGSTIADILRSMQTRVMPVTRRWTTITWNPRTAGDFDYRAQTGSVTADLNMVLALHSAAPDAQFEWEYVAFTETVGPVVFGVGKTHSDAVGFAASQYVAQKDEYVHTGNGPSWKSTIKSIADAVRDGSRAFSAAANFVGGAAAGPLMIMS